MITLLEKQFGRPFHRLICLIHFNELPLRAIFTTLDGTTTGPNTFTGPIGKSLENCESMPVTNFKRIFTDDMPVLSKEILKDLSTDQLYLYEIIDVIQTGKCSSSLQCKKPGPTNHARFLTFACRACRLYISTAKPSKDLQLLIQFIVRVYGPMWFLIKRQPQIFHAPRHLFKYIQLIQWLPVKYKEIVQDVISRNSYYAHPENILMSMIADDQLDVRKQAVDIILKTRASSTTGVRKFKLPSIDFKAKVYYDMIDFEEKMCLNLPFVNNFQMMNCRIL